MRKTVWTQFEEVPSEVATEIGYVIHAFAYLELILRNVFKRSRNVSLERFRKEKKYKEIVGAGLGAILNGITSNRRKWIFFGMVGKSEQFYEGLIKEAQCNSLMAELITDLNTARDLVKIRNKYAHTALCKDKEWFFDGKDKIEIPEILQELRDTRQTLGEIIPRLDAFKIV